MSVEVQEHNGESAQSTPEKLYASVHSDLAWIYRNASQLNNLNIADHNKAVIL